MEEGKINQSGSYEELLTSGMAFEQLVNAHRDAMTVLDTSNNEPSRIAKGKLCWNRDVSTSRVLPHKGKQQGEIFCNGVLEVQLTKRKRQRLVMLD